jgi:hypothetical protein
LLRDLPSHLDLKTHNILVDKNWTAKVGGTDLRRTAPRQPLLLDTNIAHTYLGRFSADFGLSRVLQADKNRGQAGSPGTDTPSPPFTSAACCVC